MKRNDATFKEMVTRLQSGAISRAQACDEYGLKYVTLSAWLIRSKLNDSVPRAGALHGARALHGVAKELAESVDADKAARINSAVARVLAGEISARAASKEDPTLSSRTLAARVLKAKKAAGVPIPKRTRRPDPTTPHDTQAAQEIAELKKKLETAELVKGRLENQLDKMKREASELKRLLNAQPATPATPKPATPTQ